MRKWFTPTEKRQPEPVIEDGPRRRLWSPIPNLCGITDAGTTRGENEDRFYISDDLATWVIADGMGGLARGSLAAETAVSAIAESLHQQNALSYAVPERERVLSAIRSAHDRVLDCGRTCPEGPQQMGAAVVAATVIDHMLHVGHVGDVRTYVYSRKTLYQITQDHSVAAAMVRAGLLSSHDARSHPDKALLQQAIGLPRGISPDFVSYRLLHGDRVLLCSDGLWEALSESEISEILQADGSMRQLASVLVNRAITASGGDNITVIAYLHAPQGFPGRNAARGV